MTRLLAGLIVFALASPALGGPAEDKNWGDKQTRERAAPSNLKEKEGKFPLEKQKIQDMKVERKK
jgi:hypothetical protein